MENISDEQRFLLCLGFLLLIACLSVIAYGLRMAECYEHDIDPIDPPGHDTEPVNYKDIQDCERPFIENQFN